MPCAWIRDGQSGEGVDGICSRTVSPRPAKAGVILSGVRLASDRACKKLLKVRLLLFIRVRRILWQSYMVSG